MKSLELDTHKKDNIWKAFISKYNILNFSLLVGLLKQDKDIRFFQSVPFLLPFQCVFTYISTHSFKPK